MRRRATYILLGLIALVALALPAGATAKKSKRPVITRVSPMRLAVGSKLTIRGKNFSSRARSNTVIFRSPGGRSAFVKPRRASRRKLVLRVSPKVARLLPTVSGGRKATRLKLRVIVRRRYSSWTRKRLSPVVVSGADADVGGGGGGGGEVSSCVPGDYDGDLLSGDKEVEIGTDPCLADTDGDGSSDGWEYYSAKDLNIKAVPYPGTRPYPNALDPSDANIDFDGDGLVGSDEYRAWRTSGSSFNASLAGGSGLDSPLGYSDGTKYSRYTEAPSVPAWRGPGYGLGAPTQPFPATYNLHGDAAWRDDERDADRDGLSNYLESRNGPSNNHWWEQFWASKRFEPGVEPWKTGSYCGYRPGHFDERPFANLDLANSDVDGDTLLDGEDDQDNDGYSNITEMYEIVKDLDGNGQPAWCGWGVGVVPTIAFGGGDAPINAMNPCVPNPASRSCDDYVPF
jgi:hypothetical protein